MTSTTREPIRRVAVLIPTYNERDNLPRIVSRLRTSVPDADLVILDDNSPDGTGDVAAALAAADPRIRVVHRAGKEGLAGRIPRASPWRWTRPTPPSRSIADGSHQPEQLPPCSPRSRTRISSSGLAGCVGSGPQLAGPAQGALGRRQRLHEGAARHAGQRRDSRLPRLPHERVARDGPRGVESQGYCFQIDLTLRAVRAGLTVVEVPITFVEREVGVSKMGKDIVREALTNVTKWGIEYRPGRPGRSCSASSDGPSRRRRTRSGSDDHTCSSTTPATDPDRGAAPAHRPHPRGHGAHRGRPRWLADVLPPRRHVGPRSVAHPARGGAPGPP